MFFIDSLRSFGRKKQEFGAQSSAGLSRKKSKATSKTIKKKNTKSRSQKHSFLRAKEVAKCQDRKGFLSPQKIFRRLREAIRREVWFKKKPTQKKINQQPDWKVEVQKSTSGRQVLIQANAQGLELEQAQAPYDKQESQDNQNRNEAREVKLSDQVNHQSSLGSLDQKLSALDFYKEIRKLRNEFQASQKEKKNLQQGISELLTHIQQEFPAHQQQIIERAENTEPEKNNEKQPEHDSFPAFQQGFARAFQSLEQIPERIAHSLGKFESMSHVLRSQQTVQKETQECLQGVEQNLKNLFTEIRSFCHELGKMQRYSLEANADTHTKVCRVLKEQSSYLSELRRQQENVLFETQHERQSHRFQRSRESRQTWRKLFSLQAMVACILLLCIVQIFPSLKLEDIKSSSKDEIETQGANSRNSSASQPKGQQAEISLKSKDPEDSADSSHQALLERLGKGAQR